MVQPFKPWNFQIGMDGRGGMGFVSSSQTLWKQVGYSDSTYQRKNRQLYQKPLELHYEKKG